MQTQHGPALVPPATEKAPFHFKFIKPSDVLVNGQVPPVPYLTKGLLTLGGLSVLGAKPKQGKSSIARYLSVCTAQGKPFLGRDTIQGDVIIINLEDPLNHVVTCLNALGYDPNKDGQIHIVETLSAVKQDNIEALVHALHTMSDVRLVVIDHLAKFLRVSDLGDYSKVQRGFKKLHDVARAFPKSHIQALAHCKKVSTEDPFDGILGSTALRGEPDTNIVIYQADGRRFITSETRVGKAIPATELQGETVEVEDGDVVKNFLLGTPHSLLKSEKAEKKQNKIADTMKNRIVDFLLTCDGYSAPLKDIMDAKQVTGSKPDKTEAIKELRDGGVVVEAERPGKGTPHNVTLKMGTPACELFMIGRGE